MNQSAVNQFGLTDREMKEISRILSECAAVQRVLIFGSRAKGSFHTGSDIDLAIENPGVSSRELIALAEKFRDSTLPVNVDLVDYNALTHQPFIEHIDRVGKLFFER